MIKLIKKVSDTVKANVTKLNSYTDDIIAGFINICNDCLPLPVEEEYIKLTNLLSTYFEKRTALINLQNGVESTNQIIESSKVKQRLQKTKCEIIMEQIKALTNNEDHLDPNTYSKILSLAKEGYIASQNYYSRNNIYQNNQRIANNRLNQIDELTREIATIIDSIKNTLKNILALDINEKRRLDNITVSQRHFDKIKALFPKYSTYYTSSVEDLLKSHTASRIASFNIIEILASKIIDLYNRGIITEGIDEKEIDLFKLVISALSASDFSYFTSAREILDIEKNNNQTVPILNIATNYLRSGNINPEQIENYTSTVLDFNFRMLINSLNTIIKNYYKIG